MVVIPITMEDVPMRRLLLAATIVLIASGLYVQADESGSPFLKGPYLGQKPPGTTPEVFAPGFVSTPAHEFSCSFTPDGKEFYFARRDPNLNYPVVMATKLLGGTWTKPALVPFVDGGMSFEPIVTPDGGRLYFMSGKPVPGQAGPPMNIFYVDREGDAWSSAKNAGAPFNPAKAMFISSTSDGTIYTTDISQGPGSEAIAVARKIDGEYKTLERVGPPVNAGTQSMYPFIAPDGSYLIFNSRRPAEKIQSVLLVSFRTADGGWSEPRLIDLGAEAGTPFVSRDGEFLFFTSGEKGKSDIYWVSAEVIEALRPKR
jgi:Tol biopolymer transport system component